MTPVFAGFMRKADHVKQGEICSEAAVSVLLSNQTDAPALCSLEGLMLLNEPEPAELADAIRSVTGGNAPSAVMTGMSGNSENDSWYGFLKDLLPGVPLLRYKHLFGVNFSSSAIGFYAAACCIKKGLIPACLTMEGAPVSTEGGILIVNVVEGRHYSISLLKPI